MKLLPDNIGAEPKKLALLGGVIIVGLGLYHWTNSSSDAPPQAAGSSTGSVSTAATGQPSPNTSTGSKSQTRAGSSRTVEDFRPSIKVPEGVDISRVDPRLKTNFLARLRALPDEGSTRSVFEFYVPPPPPPPVAAIKPAPPAPVTPPPGPVKPPGPPPILPITIKLYALVGPPGKARKVFFLDGEDSFMVAENDTIRGRYKIIHLGVLDAEVEDTVTNRRETIRIIPEMDP